MHINNGQEGLRMPEVVFTVHAALLNANTNNYKYIHVHAL